MKKTLQLLLLLITFLTASISSAQAIGDTFTVNDVIYTITALPVAADPVNEIEAANGQVNAGDNGNEGASSGTAAAVANLIIPASVMSVGETYDVTGIEWQGFAGNTGIEMVDLSALTITSLPQQGFYANTALTTVILPSTLTQIGRSCFQNCSAVTSINTENITDLGQQSAMGEMGALTSVDFSNVTSIGKRSFRSANAIASLELPSIESLGQNAITSTTMTSLILGPNLNAFDGNGINSIDNLVALEIQIDTQNPGSGFDAVSASVPTITNIANVTLFVPTAADKTAWEATAWGTAGFKDILVGTALSTNKVEQALGLKLYPNPTNGIVTIESTSNNTNVTVYDINGRSLLKTDNLRVDISKYAAGMYIFKVETGNGQVVKRILKN